ncbi:translocation/assembly module TamB domain-containing protein [Primorskyibacter sp. 2E233]|uniref:translocation/assembly module TamB domain-containing protein n=1 Tax=Primorskyibacter sp. 2E233 TaxID=3413431 RepID=UPI003BF07070
MRWIVAVFLVLLQTLSTSAQEDKDRLTRYLEGALSGLGRQVTVEGFRGALSSRATMDKLTIADADGIWLTLTDAVLDWNRTAVLGGRIEINELSAAQIDLPRLPTSESSASAEARAFTLPELPVSVRIEKISVARVTMGAPIIGVPAVASIQGDMQLADGEGTANLEITRLEGPSGEFVLDAGYSNASQELSVDLSLKEAENGIAANLLNLPGKPAIELTTKGTAPIDDYTADIVLLSDGQERLTGQVETQAGSGEEGDPRLIRVDISGDLTPLFVPQYQSFFGPEVALRSRISLYPDGRVAMDDLTATAAALRLNGNFALAAGGLPESFRLDAVLMDPNGAPVQLPISGAETKVQMALITASFDSKDGDTWTLNGDLKDLRRPDVTLDDLKLVAGGSIQNGEVRQVSARIDASAKGAALADPALQQALGSMFDLGADIVWREGAPIQFSNLDLSAPGMQVTGDGTLDGLDTNLTVNGALKAQVDNLSRFSAISGQNLRGGVQASLDGQTTILTGAFDLDLVATGRDLAIGNPDVDDLLAGESRLNVSALRSSEGLTLRRAEVKTRGVTAQGSGRVATDDSDLTFDARLANLGKFVPSLSGPATAKGRAQQNSAGWTVSLDGTAPRAITLSAQLSLPKQAEPSAEFDARIGSLAWLAPELAGPGSIRGTARRSGSQWVLDTAVQGPGGSAANVAGQIAQDARTAALGLNGTLPLGLVNRRLNGNSIQGLARFDLRIDGALALSSVSGQITTAGARLALPGLRNALKGIDANVTLNGGQANFEVGGTLDTGGRVGADGRVRLQAPFVTEAELKVNNVKITDPELYETRANGDLRLSGTAPGNLAISGQLALDQTEIRVPSTGIGSFESIPDIIHLNEPASVRRTRSYAGLLDVTGASGGGSGVAVALNVEILALNRIFVRGRGLDAELGGQLRLTGTTADVIPQGRFDLIRGRLDILGKRLTLEEGSARLQGDMVPTLRLVARTTAEDTVVFVTIEGRADAPEIRFESDPQLPEDEVLARLLFGRGISSISALQAVQLASAVATLAGKGGVGIIERLRESTGVDDLDVTTDGEGGATLRIGKYISEKAYTNVEVDSNGQSQINLNLDLSPSTTLRGHVGTDGRSGVGIFFERDY